MDFMTSLNAVLIAILYMIPAFLLTKAKLTKPEHSKTLSAVLIYVSGPTMIINAFTEAEFTGETALSMLYFFVVTLVLQIIVLGFLFLLFRKKFEMAKYRILTMASVFGNVGFFGMPLIKSLLPGYPLAMCYSSMFMLSMNILIFTMGVYCLTKEKKHISLKSAIVNPTFITMIIAIPLFVFNIDLPYIIDEACLGLSRLTMPLCMIILGIRLASVDLKNLFTRPFIYMAALNKLVVFPLFCYFAVYFLPFDYVFKASILILCCAPCAAVILTLAEVHEKETELAANCIIITTILSILTIPLVLLIL